MSILRRNKTRTKTEKKTKNKKQLKKLYDVPSRLNCILIMKMNKLIVVIINSAGSIS
jgi:hypothetical protein